MTRGQGFAILVVAILGLGIGAASSVFAFVEALLRPLPFPHPERLVMLWEGQREKGREKLHVSPPNLTDWSTQTRDFSDLAAFTEDSFTISGERGAERLSGATVSLRFFQTLGITFEKGQGFVRGDDKGTQAYVVVLSHALWQSRFGGSPDLIGRSIRIDGLPRTVVGIVPQGKEFPRGAKLWLPLVFCDCDQARDKHYLAVVGRTKPGIGLNAAQAEMDTIAGRLAAQYPATNAGWSVHVVPLADELIGDARPALGILAGAVALLVLIACANVASLLLARGLFRGPEIAVRQAVGASRSQISLQLFVESLCFAVLGSLVGVVLSWALLRAALPLIPAQLGGRIELDGQVLGFALALGALTSLAFGLIPALQASRHDLAETLKPGARGSAGARTLLLRNGIVVAEFAFAFALLVNSILLLWSFATLLLVDPGFQPHRILSARIGLESAKYEKTERQVLFFSELKRRVAALPGIDRVAAVDALPMTGSTEGTLFLPEGRPTPKHGEEPSTRVSVATEGYFRTLGIPVVRGREFTERDAASSPPVVIVNETLARRYFPGESPIGHRIKMGDLSRDIWHEIVGVVGDARYEGLSVPTLPRVFTAFRQAPETGMTLVLATRRPTSQVIGGLRRELAAMDGDVPAYNLQTLDDIVGDSLAHNRLVVVVVAAFAAAALLLSVIGLYGVMASNVAYRRKELGIRIALGSAGGHLVWLVLRRALALALLGALVGALLATISGRTLTALLFEIQPVNAATYGLAAVILLAVALAGSASAARNAVRLDPVAALQSE